MFFLIGVVCYILNSIAFMNLAAKAGRPEIGWMAWIPIANIVQQLLLINKSGWWVLLTLIPVVDFIFYLILQVQLLEVFGKSGAFVLFAIFLPPVYFILWIVWAFSEHTEYNEAMTW